MTVDILATTNTQARLLQIGQYELVASPAGWYIFEPGADQLTPTTIAVMGREDQARRVAAALALLDLAPGLFGHLNPFSPHTWIFIVKLRAIVQFAFAGMPAWEEL